jgi:hypothetical protein
MRVPGIQATRFVSSMLLFAGLTFCRAASAQTPPPSQPAATGAASNAAAGATNTACAAQSAASSTANVGAAAKTGNTQQSSSSVDAAAQNAKAALQNLGSLFGKKKAQTAASAPPPCPPATATAAPGSPGSAAPSAGAAAQPSDSSAQPSAPNSAAPSTATGGNAAPWSPDSGATTGVNATAGSAAPFASSGPPDFSKLPDIGGTLRVGLSPDEAQAAMLKMHPGFKVVPGTLTPLSRDGKPPLPGLRGRFEQTANANGPHVEDVDAYYTMPPTKQQAYAVSRQYYYPDPGIERLKLIAALRQKYGPETKAGHEWDKTKEGTGDGRITSMYWVYDEQGHVIPPGTEKSGYGQPAFNCSAIFDANQWGNLANQYRLNTLPPANFCDTVVMLSVTFAATYQSPYCTATETQIYDFALLRRDIQIAGEAAKADAQKQHQQEIDQSKQAKPSL